MRIFEKHVRIHLVLSISRWNPDLARAAGSPVTRDEIQVGAAHRVEVFAPVRRGSEQGQAEHPTLMFGRLANQSSKLPVVPRKPLAACFASQRKIRPAS